MSKKKKDKMTEKEKIVFKSERTSKTPVADYLRLFNNFLRKQVK